MVHSTTPKRDHGFTLLEMLIVLAVMMILAAITVPRFLNIIGDINLRYVATNYSGLLQSARIQSVRKNDYYGIQQTTLATGGNAYFVHLHSGSYTVGDPLLPVGSRIGVHAGTGSGAPNESTLTCGSGCTSLPALQLRQDSSNAQGARAMAEGVSVHVWSLREIAELLSKFYFFFCLLVGNVLLGIFF